VLLGNNVEEYIYIKNGEGKGTKNQPLNEFNNLKTNLIPEERSRSRSRIVEMQIGVNKIVCIIMR
jgi:hypothetical protein